MGKREFTPERITSLRPNEIFVFGSNLGFGAVWGQGEGLQGQSYALPTIVHTVAEMQPYVDRFVACAQMHPELKFYLTEVGCGIAGFTVNEVAPLFAKALEVPNIVLPERFFRVLQG